MKTLTIPNRAYVAFRLGTSPQYLYQIETRRRMAGRHLALAIERETRSAVSRYELRPDIWPQKPAKKKTVRNVKRAS